MPKNFLFTSESVNEGHREFCFLFSFFVPQNFSILTRAVSSALHFSPFFSPNS